MANTILITANWHTGALSQQTISRQYDNNRYVVQFVGYPEASDGNELDYYLLVWMSSAPGEKPDEIAPIQLASDQWYISNYFTQQVQVIKFQLCVLNEAGTYEAHSPIFSGRIGDSLEHDGTTQDIDVSTLFDAYREYLNELIIRSGAVVIDPTLSQGGQAADAEFTGYVKDDTRKNTDYVRDLQKEINGAYDLDLQWEQGNLNYSGAVDNTKVIRTSNYFETNGLTGITADIESGYVVTIVKYSGNTNPQTEILGYITITNGETVIPDGTYSYFRVKMGPDPSAGITPVIGRKLTLKVTVGTSMIARIEEIESQIETSLIEQFHTNAIGPMVEIAETYFNVAYDPNDQIVYHTHRGLYAPETETDDGKKAIVCSQFATACMSAVPYEYSRYVKDDNQSLWWGLHTDGTGTYGYDDYMIARDMALYCESQGWLHPFDVDHNDMKPGDLIFYTSTNLIENVGHVAIALVVGKNKYICMESIDTVTRLVDGADVGVITRLVSYSGYKPAFYAHIPVIASEYKTVRVVQDNNIYTETIDTGSVRINYYNFESYLKKGFYSFTCDYDGNNYPYIKVYYEDGQSVNYSSDEVIAGKYNCVFYAQMPIKNIDVRCVGAGTHTVKNIAIRKGFYLYS